MIEENNLNAEQCDSRERRGAPRREQLYLILRIIIKELLASVHVSWEQNVSKEGWESQSHSPIWFIKNVAQINLINRQVSAEDQSIMCVEPNRAKWDNSLEPHNFRSQLKVTMFQLVWATLTDQWHGNTLHENSLKVSPALLPNLVELSERGTPSINVSRPLLLLFYTS